MRAAVVSRYGPPESVRVLDRPEPRPGKGEVVVRMRATAVTAGDARIRAGRFPPGFGVVARLGFGIRGPRRDVLGAAVSGVVERVGPGVTGLQPGDAVCAMTGARFGCHADLVVVPASRLVRRPAGVSDSDAAGVLFGGTTALYFLRDKARLSSGKRVLVNGASGAVGSNAVQLAAHAGAVVTAVTSGPNADLVRQLGAAEVIDHTRTDVRELGQRFDVVMDAVGTIPIAAGRAMLTDAGVLLLVVGGLGEFVRARGQVIAGSAPERVEDVEELLRLVAAGTLRVVVDSTYDLADIARAHARVDTGHKVGNVIVRP
ncbi:NAD(P)-dependent alcohol dehydrogenase [Georgenia deserti]|uniref:NAD(P)-dependent alcohol dehydrogenase n=1 Tax=Georgenia deserti TaxID=2093781 RepID=A0ABW4L658_9MICO